MAKNNVMAEIKELFQYIKTNYQEGVDFEIITEGESKHAWGYEIKSSRLKKFLREKFKILVLAKKGILDYWFSYKVEDEPDERENTDCLLASEKGESQWNETENCKQCNQSVAKKEGWIHQWDGRKKTGKPKPKTIAYFHPKCAKKYFADKNQPDQNNKKITDDEQEWLKNLFQKYHIEKISFENGSLFIEYDKEVNSLEKAKVDSKSFQELKEYFQNHDEKEIDKRRLGINSNNTTNSEPNQGNYQLIIGLSLGAGAVILVGLIVFFVFRKRKNK